MRKLLQTPFESRVFPESVIYCLPRPGTKFVSLSRNQQDEPDYPVPLIDRTMQEPVHYFSVCVAPFFGTEPKWLMISEFVEYYKLQGATHFFFYVVNLSNYDMKILNDYVRTGDAEVTIIYNRFDRAEYDWQRNIIQNCLLRSRNFSYWTAFVDLDERLAMTLFNGTVVDYLKQVKDPLIGNLQFRQTWLMKTETQPERYVNDEETVKWMPTQRYLNTSSVGPHGHTTKCIVRSNTVGAMFVHYPIVFYPGYKKHEMEPREGVVRHYRDLNLGNWGKTWLKDVEKFGPFQNTKMDLVTSHKLIDAVVKRVKYVYEKS
ncbi:hypothetical protein WR25_19101 [Diploscapter pachys]|uniref:Glycosyltransferase family 92 protein n=1 Tax=Diploscapter pachys TaxID=2018661 RepID=A0A2A2LN76_9BILA|nr:hypothetical protein WR25_19101 [Diploscapter pachys]